MKKFLSIISILIIMLTTSACNPENKPSIIFNQRPITVENVRDMSSVFKPGTRIYYLILMPQVQHSRILDIQIIKKGAQEYLGYSSYMSRTIRLKNEEQKYFTDYMVINETGAFIMRVYSKDNPTKILTQAEFYVR